MFESVLRTTKIQCMVTNRHKELYSFAFINAVAARVGFEMSLKRLDDDGVDGRLESLDAPARQINFQAKSTSRDEVWRGDHIAFPLPVHTYHQLRDTEATVPAILIVVLVPDNPFEWLRQDEEQLCMTGRAYWISLRDSPEVSNTTSKTVIIPTTNIFDQVQLADMLPRLDRREWP